MKKEGSSAVKLNSGLGHQMPKRRHGCIIL
jgi:hypothetical protein